MPQCATCGSQVSAQDRVCPACGMELGASPPPPSYQPPAPPADVAGSMQESPASGVSDDAPHSQLPTAMAKLIVRRAGTLTNETFPLGERVVIGRFDVETGPVDVDMALLPESAYLSRRHAEIWRDANGNWFIKDLGSQNGTFVRPAASSQFQRITQSHPINNGDEIAFGNARFEFRTG